MKLSKNTLYMIIIILVSVLLYANTFKNEFVFDDFTFIVENPDIRSLSNIPEFFVEPQHGSLYRPLRQVWYTVVYNFSKINTFGYHLSSIILHTIISLLVYGITVLLFRKKSIALIAALFFVAHPIHTGRITNMTGSFDMLGIMFMFASFYLYILYSNQNKKRLLLFSLLLFIAAVFSSEEALMLILIIPLYELAFGKGKELIEKKDFTVIKKFIPYVVIGILFLSIRFTILQQVGRSTVYYTGDFATSIFTTIVIFVRYIKLLFFPYPLNVEYVHNLHGSFFEWPVILSFIVLAMIFIYGLYNFKRNKLIFFAILWFFITLLPFANLLPVFTLMAERYLYVPSFAFCLLAALVFDKVYHIPNLKKNMKSALIIAVVTILLAYSFVVVQRNAEWQTNIDFWITTINREPRADRAHANLGQIFHKLGNYEQAFDELQTAILLNPRNHIAHGNLGAVYADLGEFELAKESLLISLSINDYAFAQNNLALIYDQEQNFSAAISLFEDSLVQNPKAAKTHNDLAKTLVKIGDFERAEKEFIAALNLQPEIPEYHYNYGILLELQERNELAEQAFYSAFQLDPDNPIYQNKYQEYLK